MTKPTAFFLTLSMTIMMGCKPKEPETPQSRNATLPRLPVASAAEKIEEESVHFIELQLADGKWNVDGGTPITTTDELERQIKSSKSTLMKNGYQPKALVEASPATPFKQIRAIARTCAAMGIDRVMFAVKTSVSSPDTLSHSLNLDIICAICCYKPTAIDPMFIRADGRGAVHVNAGPAQELVDGEHANHDLPALGDRLDSYGAAAKAGGLQPKVRIWIDQDAPYQRFIDILNLLKKNGIRCDSNTFSDDGTGFTTCGGMGSKIEIPVHQPPPPAPSIPNPVRE